ncbi:hypothetical protein TNCV_465101 [Trichonephila clavipes]|nr:hypothetical protein TNCV_465101 [Trichonephila clavipes]
MLPKCHLSAKHCSSTSFVTLPAMSSRYETSMVWKVTRPLTNRARLGRTWNATATTLEYCESTVHLQRMSLDLLQKVIGDLIDPMACRISEMEKWIYYMLM